MRYDKTNIGGPNEAFQTTHWTAIVQVRETNEAKRKELLGQLLQTYWKPVYCYLRRKGCDNETAKDLTQGFFGEVVLGRDLVERADRKKGKFRTFLLTALERYATSVHRGATAKKRAPSAGLVSLQGVEEFDLPDVAGGATPEQTFAYGWAAALLDKVLAEIEGTCRRSGQQAYWAVFQARVIRPILENREPVSLPQLCAEHNIESAAMASNIIVTMKRRFRKALYAHIRQLVSRDEDVEEEIAGLMEILSSPGARS